MSPRVVGQVRDVPRGHKMGRVVALLLVLAMMEMLVLEMYAMAVVAVVDETAVSVTTVLL